MTQCLSCIFYSFKLLVSYVLKICFSYLRKYCKFRGPITNNLLYLLAWGKEKQLCVVIVLQVHGNVCLASIVVTQTLDWKLHAFDVLSEFDGNSEASTGPMLVLCFSGCSPLCCSFNITWGVLTVVSVFITNYVP